MKELRINEQITSSQVRIVGVVLPTQVISKEAALKIAKKEGVDLVEVNSNIDPPVCKFFNYQKYCFEQKQKEKLIKANAKQIVVKEIKLSPNIGEHDYQFKLKHAKEFLEKDNHLLISIVFKGRAITHPEIGEKTLLRFCVDLEDIGVAENTPKLEGKRMFVKIKPKK